jgi:elongation factor Ts
MTEKTMTNSSAAQVQELRQLTGAGMMDCKRALQEANGDIEVARDFLRKKGLDTANKKAGRTANEGQVFSYIHLGGKIGVLLEINCETDFVARNSDFQQFGKDIAMQIAAVHPEFVSKEEVSEAWLAKEKEIILDQVKDKPAPIQENIIQGKLEKRYEEICLLNQKFIKDEDKTVQDLLTELISKTGERIVIKRFHRFEVGSA